MRDAQEEYFQHMPSPACALSYHTARRFAMPSTQP